MLLPTRSYKRGTHRFTHIVSMLSSLPIELLDGVCQCLSPSDLISLSLTSSWALPVAQRLLYREVSVSHTHHNLGIVVTLAKKADIARCVRVFSIHVDPSSTVLFSSFYRELATALSSMTELTSLEVFVDPQASWVLPVTRTSTFPRLLRFSCSFPLDYHVGKFLEKSESLAEVQVDSLVTPQMPHDALLSAASMPSLAQFSGSSEAAKYIVPGRPVQSIHIDSGDLTEDVVDSLAESASRITVLGAMSSLLPIPLLRLLSQRMPHLVYLRITATCSFEEAPDVVSRTVPKLIIQFLTLAVSSVHRISMKKLLTIWRLYPICRPLSCRGCIGGRREPTKINGSGNQNHSLRFLLRRMMSTLTSSLIIFLHIERRR